METNDEIIEIISKTRDLRLLFIEDNKDVRISNGSILESFFDHIVFAINGEDGLKKFNENTFDLIISDINMPKLDGISMVKQIREIDQFIPIILLSAHTETNYFLDSIDLGIDGYLYKPLELDKLLFYLKRIIQRVDSKSAQNYEQKCLLDTLDKNVILSKTDLKGNIIHVSDAFCQISGYSKNELLNKPHNIVRHPDMPNEIYIYMWTTIQNKEIWEGEIKNLHKDGSSYWVHSTITPNYDYQGNHIGYTSIRKNIAMQKEVEILNNSLEMKVEAANKEISQMLRHTKESIEYSALIQSSLIPDNNIFRKYFQEYFVIWHPKDIVGGDIYMFNELRNDNECLLLCIDCTGHGVPGAFVTMLVKAVEAQLMVEIYNNPDMEISTAWVMGYFNKKLKTLLKQDTQKGISNVGWDGSILYYNKEKKIVKFSGAESPMFYRTPKGEIKTIKGTRKSVGYKQCPMDYEYKESVIEVQSGTKLYLTTDGYLDQNGGEKDFPFGKKRFLQIIEDYGSETMAEQQEMFMYEMAEYEEMILNNERNDDMTVIGITI